MRWLAGILVLGSLFLIFAPCVSWGEERTVTTSRSRYVASKFSIQYHKGSCKKALIIPEQNRITFSKAKEAAKAGYMPCPRCKPTTQK